MSIGERIRQLRGKETRKALSDKLGVVQNTLARYENNERLADTEFVSRICALYNVTADWLIFGKENSNIQGQVKTVAPPSEPAKPTAPLASPLPKASILNEFPKQAVDVWLMDMPADRFDQLWAEYRNSTMANKGWSQIELIKRFPEFIEWLEEKLGLVDDDEDDEEEETAPPLNIGLLRRRRKANDSDDDTAQSLSYDYNRLNPKAGD